MRRDWKIEGRQIQIIPGGGGYKRRRTKRSTKILDTYNYKKKRAGKSQTGKKKTCRRCRRERLERLETPPESKRKGWKRHFYVTHAY